ncbi:hypothetical protein RRG08_056370 [Elysia crispata]|uniref:Uncharacterized protein n=1 Tax=Elysia crispata TaxID=231223 RepID=A0AAE0ZRL5_9GAST|nr:hypothetical protein RRG08_056370 [Elysia crispata]
MKAKLGISRDKFRDLSRMLKVHNVHIENEASQRMLQKEVLPADIITETLEFTFKDENKRNFKESSPAVFIDDLRKYIFDLLDQYQEQKLLTWHDGGIPEGEVWIKLGGDHGQGSLKAMVQIANLAKPNSKFCTSVFAMAKVPDNPHNLYTLLNRYKIQIESLQSDIWNEKDIRVFLFGDYHFLADVHGISGAAGLHPCLWCLLTNKEINFPYDPTNPPPPRTDDNLKRDLKNFAEAGNSDEKKAKYYRG